MPRSSPATPPRSSRSRNSPNSPTRNRTQAPHCEVVAGALNGDVGHHLVASHEIVSQLTAGLASTTHRPLAATRRPEGPKAMRIGAPSVPDPSAGAPEPEHHIRATPSSPPTARSRRRGPLRLRRQRRPDHYERTASAAPSSPAPPPSPGSPPAVQGGSVAGILTATGAFNFTSLSIICDVPGYRYQLHLWAPGARSPAHPPRFRPTTTSTRAWPTLDFVPRRRSQWQRPDDQRPQCPLLRPHPRWQPIVLNKHDLQPPYDRHPGGLSTTTPATASPAHHRGATDALR